MMDRPTDGRTDGRTDGPTDGRTDGPTKRGVESRSTRLKRVPEGKKGPFAEVSKRFSAMDKQKLMIDM